MGCDIHLYTEAKSSVNGKDKWVNIDHWKLNKYFGEENESQFSIIYLYHDRNYSLFAALAGIRDYSEGNPKVDEPRGMPDDVSEATQAECDKWDSDGHTHSYFTLKELTDWQAANAVVHHSGLISAEQAEALDKRGELPQSWCQGTNRPDYVHRAWTEDCQILAPLIEALEERAREEFWIWDKTAPIPIDKQEQIRIVFWFDN